MTRDEKLKSALIGESGENWDTFLDVIMFTFWMSSLYSCFTALPILIPRCEVPILQPGDIPLHTLAFILVICSSIYFFPIVLEQVKTRRTGTPLLISIFFS